MIQELANSVWEHPQFRATAKEIERLWLCRELKIRPPVFVRQASAARAMSAAAILACSTNLEHRVAALRLATYIFEAFDGTEFAFDSALRVVLTRLKNFPAIETRASIAQALPTLPLTLAIEEITEANYHTVWFGEQRRLLTGFQHDLWTTLNAGQSIALSAPTSVGKSFVLELYLASFFRTGNRIAAYIVPTRALISQVSRDFANIFTSLDGEHPDIITIPTRPESIVGSNAVYVMTQERLHATLEARQDFNVDLLVVDEAHSISEGARGILLHTVIDELLSRNPRAQILFASPTTKNLDAFGRLFRREDIHPRYSREPTVSQNFITIKRTDSGNLLLTAIRDTGRTTKIGEIPARLPLRTRTDKLAHLPLLLCEGQPNLVYANGADEAEDIALAITKQIIAPNPSRRRFELSQLARESVHSKYILADCVLSGVGFHYANIPTSLRQAIESAFAEGELQYLVCTSTLLQGVNLPAKNIFMLKPTRGQGKPLDPADFWNLAGRAGRLQREFQGNIFLIDYEDWPKKPVRAARDVEIAPAIESSIKLSAQALDSIIQGKGAAVSRSKRIELESAFVRLFADLKKGQLNDTLSRLDLDDEYRYNLSSVLRDAERSISLPIEVLKHAPSVSAHRQQRLFLRIMDALARDEAVIPLAPSEPQSFNSYASILKICHEEILGIDTSRNLHRFHAVLARKWMLGYSIPRIISEGLRKENEKGRNPDTRRYIRRTLEVIEDAIRFQTIRLFGCYNTLLQHALSERKVPANIPDVELFLEIGASNITMVSLISLGLSRAMAIRLNGARDAEAPELGLDEAIEWLQSHSPGFNEFKLTDIQRDELITLLRGLRRKSDRSAEETD